MRSAFSIIALSSRAFAKCSAAWTAALDADGLSWGPINTLEQVFDHPQVQARGMRVEMDHPLSGTVPLVGSPLKLSASPVSYRRHPPTLGEHTDAILAELGRDAGEIATLREQGVI